MMNYPYPTASPYIHAAMSQAVHAMMAGKQLPANCMLMAMPRQQGQQILPQLRLNRPIGGRADPVSYPQQRPYYGASPYKNNPPPRARPSQQNYNYPVVPYKQSKKNPFQPHSNIYNSSSFDSYMDQLSWSRLFNRPSRKNSKKQPATNSSKNTRTYSSVSSSTSSSTASDETIRRVDLTNNQSSGINAKQHTKGTLPFKYSSEYLPGLAKPKLQNDKPIDVILIKKQ